MGMLFNTEATVEIIAKVNAAFNKQGVRRLRIDQNLAGGGGGGGTDWMSIFNALPNAGGKNGTYASVVKDFPIDFDEGKSLRSKNWRAWLNKMDGSTMTNPDTGAGQINVALYIGQKISAVINDTSYDQIEFFAVPTAPPASAARNISASARDVTANAEKSMVIQINTSTVDNLR
jgi:hypothetical protein